MCLIHGQFKRFHNPKPEQFANNPPIFGKVSSIIRAKVLSIMCAGDIGLTSLFKPKQAQLWHALTHRPGTQSRRGEQAVRRQTATSGITPAGSSRALRLDPLSLPVKYDAHDLRADGGVRHIELDRERVVLRRALFGMRMAINVRVSDFLGVALRGGDDAQTLVLAHRDPSLTIPLCVSSDREEIAAAWQMWSDFFALPLLTENNGEPAPRRRATTRSAIVARNFWFAGAVAICSTQPMCTRVNARSSQEIEC